MSKQLLDPQVTIASKVYSMVGEFLIVAIDGVFKLAKITDFRFLNRSKTYCYLIVVSNIIVPNSIANTDCKDMQKFLAEKKQELDKALKLTQADDSQSKLFLTTVEGYFYIPVSFLSSRKAAFIVPHDLYGIPVLRL